MSQRVRVTTTIVIVLTADFRTNGKSRWYGKPDCGHLSEICTFASQQFSHLSVALCVLAESKNIFAFVNGSSLVLFHFLLRMVSARGLVISPSIFLLTHIFRFALKFSTVLLPRFFAQHWVEISFSEMCRFQL